MLERETELTAMIDAARCAAGGTGSVVLVSGETGIGKSRLVAELAAAVPATTRVLVGCCDDLATPRILGPLRDLAGEVGADLARALRTPADRDDLAVALRDELDWSGHATVLVVEDVHWADQASLDLLRWLVRRIHDLPAVLVLTYRGEDVTSDLQRLLGALAAPSAATQVHRLALAPLSSDAVSRLRKHTTIDTAEVMKQTGGNPFLVHELLASPLEVPASVADLVRARLGRLHATSRDAVERLCVITSAVDRDLVDDLVPGGLGALDEAERQGLLAVTAHRVAFRHELTRRAVVDDLATARRATLHAAALTALSARTDADPAQLVHHARGAGDTAAAIRHAPAAIRAATAAGAHRQAADHLRNLLVHRDALDPAELPDLLHASAVACYTVGDQQRSALADQLDAVALRRGSGDPAALGSSLRWLSRIAWWVGDRPLAESAAHDAVAVLSATDNRLELALALSNVSQLAMLAEQMDAAIVAAQRALGLARDVGDPGVLSHALNNLGTARWAMGDPGGRVLVEESRDVALAAGLAEHASRAACNLAWQLLLHLQPAEAARAVAAGIEYAEATEQVMFWKYLHVERAMVALSGARWSVATQDAAVGLDATNPIRCAALQVLARATLRSAGGADDLIEEGRALALELAEPQRVVPAAALVCEAAWLNGDLDVVREVARATYAEVRRLAVSAWRAELAHWLWLAGDPVAPAELVGIDHPYAASGRGDWTRAAQEWAQLGYPYEAAAALACADEASAALEALGQLDALGAGPLAARVRADLRRQGVDGVPRGPSAATRLNVAGLTPRQLDVLELLDDGLSSAAIAARLVLSVRTVEHHVADLMRKLGAASRAEAPTIAARLGWRRGAG